MLRTMELGQLLHASL